MINYNDRQQNIPYTHINTHTPAQLHNFVCSLDPNFLICPLPKELKC